MFEKVNVNEDDPEFEIEYKAVVTDKLMPCDVVSVLYGDDEEHVQHSFEDIVWPYYDKIRMKKWWNGIEFIWIVDDEKE